MPEETGQAFIRHADGKLWFHTGDVGVMVRRRRGASVCVLAGGGGDVWYGERRRRRWVFW
jgi:acyl-CoA synthetase (AMP-forming)/AMP-acid ligase II